MQQAKPEVTSGVEPEREPRLTGFRIVGESGFGPRTGVPKDSRRHLYGVNAGTTLFEALMEIGYLTDVIGGLARVLADELEGTPGREVQLAYAAMRMAEQASSLACSALDSQWVAE